MGEKTKISWTERTWNPWRGCTPVSPGCRNCYALRAQQRAGFDPNKVTRTKTWNGPHRWQHQAEQDGRTEMVFTCSWSDFFHAAADLWRTEAWQVIRACPNLIFQILTKRPQRIFDHLPADWGFGYENVWLGVSVEREDYLWRVDLVKRIPAQIHFLSVEPLLAPMPNLDLTGVDWLICGGESGVNFRKMDHAWVREIRDNCQAAGVPFFFKQSAGRYPETGKKLDGRLWREYPSLTAKEGE